MFCPNCGANIPNEAGFCSACGYRNNNTSVMSSNPLTVSPKRRFTVLAAMSILITLLMFLTLKNSTLFEFKRDMKSRTFSSSMGVYHSDINTGEYDGDDIEIKLERSAITFYGVLLTSAVGVCIFASMNKGAYALVFSGINLLMFIIFKSSITSTWKDFYIKGSCKGTGAFTICIFCSLALIIISIASIVFSKIENEKSIT